MTRLIDADELKLSLCRECSLYPNECLEKNGECDWNSIAHINMMKPVDAVKVIRCKDCRYHNITTFRELVLHRCYVNPDDVETSPDGYCYLAERKDNG